MYMPVNVGGYLFLARLFPSCAMILSYAVYFILWVVRHACVRDVRAFDAICCCVTAARARRRAAHNIT